MEMLLSISLKSKPISAQVLLCAHEGYHSLSQLMTAPRYYSDLEDLRVEAIITSASPRLLWLQLSGLLNPHNNSWQVINLHILLGFTNIVLVLWHGDKMIIFFDVS